MAVALLIAFTGNAIAAATGTVVGVSGECFVESGGGGGRSALALGQSLQVGDTVEVPANAKLKLRMSDGSILSLAANSRLTITAYSVDDAGKRQNATLSMPEGLLHSVVAPVDHPASFEVNTGVGTAGVRSTDWFIEAQASSDQVGVLAGSVVLTSTATGRSETIPARWGARLEAGRNPVPARVWSQQEFDAFLVRTD
jgi:hypothetical protein